MPETSDHQPPLRQKVIAGALWLVGTRWLLRALGLLSTMVLARLLMPEDFGVIAAVTAIVAILDGFFDFGFNLALIRATAFKREEYDTAWTLRIIKSTMFGVLVLCSSPIVAAYANDPNLIAVSAVVALSLIVRGFENIGIVRFEKELQYDRLLLVRLYPRLLGLVVTLGLAWWLRSYWAIVCGLLLQQTASTAFSFILCDFRPRLRLRGAARLWDFSRWIVVSSICRQIYSAVDRLALSGLVTKRELGIFSVGGSVAAMVTTELVGAAGSALIPGYAKLKDEPPRLRSAYLVSQGVLWSLLLPVAVGLAILAEPFSLFVLGPNWEGVAPILVGFVVFYTIYTVAENLSGFMAVVDLQRWSAGVGVFRTALFLVLVYPTFLSGGVLAVVALKVGISSLEMFLLLWRCANHVKCGVSDYLSQLWRPVCGLMLMVPSVSLVSRVGLEHHFTHLLVAGVVGAASYLLAIFAAWRVSGRPNGIEQILVNAGQSVFARVWHRS